MQNENFSFSENKVPAISKTYSFTDAFNLPVSDSTTVHKEVNINQKEVNLKKTESCNSQRLKRVSFNRSEVSNFSEKEEATKTVIYCSKTTKPNTTQKSNLSLNTFSLNLHLTNNRTKNKEFGTNQIQMDKNESVRATRSRSKAISNNSAGKSNSCNVKLTTNISEDLKKKFTEVNNFSDSSVSLTNDSLSEFFFDEINESLSDFSSDSSIYNTFPRERLHSNTTCVENTEYSAKEILPPLNLTNDCVTNPRSTFKAISTTNICEDFNKNSTEISHLSDSNVLIKNESLSEFLSNSTNEFLSEMLPDLTNDNALSRVSLTLNTTCMCNTENSAKESTSPLNIISHNSTGINNVKLMTNICEDFNTNSTEISNFSGSCVLVKKESLSGSTNESLSEFLSDSTINNTFSRASLNSNTTCLENTENSAKEIAPSLNISKLKVPYSNKTKKHFCIFCKTLQTKLSRHLILKHKSEKEIMSISKLSIKNKDRKKTLNQLRKNGDFLHNTNKSFNTGVLIVSRQQKAKAKKEADDYVCCRNCKGFFSKRTLRIHLRRCGESKKNDRTNIISSNKLTQYIHEDASQILKTIIFPVLRTDKITRVVRYDDLIIKYGNKMSEKSTITHQHDMVRAHLRLLGRFKLAVIELCPDVENLREIFKPQMYNSCIKAHRKVANWDEKLMRFKTPAVAQSLTSLVKKCGYIQRMEYIKTQEKDLKTNVDKFLLLWKKKGPTNSKRASRFHLLSCGAPTKNYRTNTINNVQGRKSLKKIENDNPANNECLPNLILRAMPNNSVEKANCSEENYKIQNENFGLNNFSESNVPAISNTSSFSDAYNLPVSNSTITYKEIHINQKEVNLKTTENCNFQYIKTASFNSSKKNNFFEKDVSTKNASENLNMTNCSKTTKPNSKQKSNLSCDTFSLKSPLGNNKTKNKKFATHQIKLDNNESFRSTRSRSKAISNNSTGISNSCNVKLTTNISEDFNNNFTELSNFSDSSVSVASDSLSEFFPDSTNENLSERSELSIDNTFSRESLNSNTSHLQDTENNAKEITSPLNITKLKVPYSNKTKKHFCIFCKTLQSKLSRHLILKHKSEKEIMSISKLSIKNKDRINTLNQLRKNGDFLHNTNKSFNTGVLIVSRQLKAKAKKEADDYVCCRNCKGFFSKRTLRIHLRRCGESKKNDRTNIISSNKLTQYIHEDANQILKTIIFPVLRTDKITRVIRYDDLIIKYGNKKSEKSTITHQHDMVRAHLRLLGRFKLAVIELCPDVENLREIFKPQMYNTCIKAHRKVANWDDKLMRSKTPAVEQSLTSLVKKCGHILITEYIKTQEEDLKKNAEQFLFLWEKKVPANTDNTDRIKKSNINKKRKTESDNAANFECPNPYNIVEKTNCSEQSSVTIFNMQNENFSLNNFSESNVPAISNTSSFSDAYNLPVSNSTITYKDIHINQKEVNLKTTENCNSQYIETVSFNSSKKSNFFEKDVSTKNASENLNVTNCSKTTKPNSKQKSNLSCDTFSLKLPLGNNRTKNKKFATHQIKLDENENFRSTRSRSKAIFNNSTGISNSCNVKLTTNISEDFSNNFTELRNFSDSSVSVTSDSLSEFFPDSTNENLSERSESSIDNTFSREGLNSNTSHLQDTENNAKEITSPLNITKLKVPYSNKTKKHFCIFCKTLQSKLSRHLILKHKSEKEIMSISKLSIKNKDRINTLNQLRKNGDFLHNTNKSFNTGVLIVSRQLKAKAKKEADDYVCCRNCKGFFSKTTLRIHLRRCGESKKNDRTNIISSNKLTQYIHEDANQILKTTIFPVLRNDKITRVIRYDDLIIKYGNKMSEKYTLIHQHEKVRADLRLLGHFKLAVIELCPDVKNLREIFKPQMYNTCIKAHRKVANWDDKLMRSKTPAVAQSLTSLVKKCGHLLITEYIKTQEEDLKKNAEQFLFLWEKKVPASTDNTDRDRKSNINKKRKTESDNAENFECPNPNNIVETTNFSEQSSVTTFNMQNENFSLNNLSENNVPVILKTSSFTDALNLPISNSTTIHKEVNINQKEVNQKKTESCISQRLETVSFNNSDVNNYSDNDLATKTTSENLNIITNCSKTTKLGCGESKKNDRTNKISRKKSTQYIHEDANQILKTKIFPILRTDVITSVIRFDDLIIKYGNKMAEKYTLAHQHNMVRAHLRLLGNFKLAVKELCPDVENLREIFKPHMYNICIKAHRKVANWDDKLMRSKTPAVAQSLTSLVKKCGHILITEYIKTQEEDLKKNVEQFLFLWEKKVPANTDYTDRDRKSNINKKSKTESDNAANFECLPNLTFRANPDYIMEKTNYSEQSPVTIFNMQNENFSLNNLRESNAPAISKTSSFTDALNLPVSNSTTIHKEVYINQKEVNRKKTESCNSQRLETVSFNNSDVNNFSVNDLATKTASENLYMTNCTKTTKLGCGESNKNDRTNKISSNKSTQYIHEDANQILKTKIFPILRTDIITSVIRYDDLIIKYGNKMAEKYTLAHQHNMVRAHLRLLGRFKLAVRELCPDVENLREIFKPQMYNTCIKAHRKVANWDDRWMMFKTPAVAQSLASLVKKCGNILITEYNKTHEDLKNAEQFLVLWFNY